jgi:hypothetical protein
MGREREAMTRRIKPGTIKPRTIKQWCCSISLMMATVISPAIAIAASNTGQWVPVMTDGQDRVWYVDAGTIQGRGRYRYFWSYVLNKTPFVQAGELVYGTAYYLSVDCRSKRFRLRFARLLDENSKTLKEYNYGDNKPLGSIPPGTGEEASIKFVCSRK